MTPKQFKQILGSIRPSDRIYIVLYSLLWIATVAAVIYINSWVALAIAVATAPFLYMIRFKSAADPELPTQLLVAWALVAAAGIFSYNCYAHTATAAAIMGWHDSEGLWLVRIYGTALFAALVPVFWHLAYTKIQLKINSKKIKGRKAHDIFS